MVNFFLLFCLHCIIYVSVSQTFESSTSVTLLSNLDDLLDGDVVAIRNYYGGYLTDDGDGTVSTNPVYNSQSDLFEVIRTTNTRVRFRNRATGLYLKYAGTTLPLRSESIGGSGDGATFKQGDESGSVTGEDNFNYFRQYSQINSGYNTNYCLSATQTVDTQVDGVLCSTGGADTFFTFEVVGSLTFVANVNDLLDGDIVLIQNYHGGYITDDQDGTVSSHPAFDSQADLWQVVRISATRVRFLNLESGLYLKFAGSGAPLRSEAINGSGNGATFKQRGQFSEFSRSYSQINSVYSFNYCIASEAAQDTSINGALCDGANEDSYYSFQVVGTV